MDADKLLVLAAGAAAIGFVHWFFLMRKGTSASAASGVIDVRVDGGYSPERILVPAGAKTVINFTRTDPSTCLEEIVISDLKIREFLPLDRMVSIEVAPAEKGEYPFSCGMNMFHGKIIAQ